jgi:hypothetical protein
MGLGWIFGLTGKIYAFYTDFEKWFVENDFPSGEVELNYV